MPPITPLLDDFNRANADSLGAAWAGPFKTGALGWGVESNRAAPSIVTTGGSGTIAFTSPVAYQTFQRNGSNQATLPVRGTYTGNPTAIQARWRGGPWQVVVWNPTGGTFNGAMENQPPGQGALEVRFANAVGVTASVNYVGVGDVFIIAGQSNAAGYSDALFSYSHASLRAAMYGNDYTWKELTDPTDVNTGQVDSVSSDALCYGSCWPGVATSYMASQNCPVAFVPCALSGSGMTPWQPGANHQDRATLYGSMVYRALQTGGCRCVLWWQGEEDAVIGTSRAQYNTWLDTLADAVYADLGVKLMVAKLELLVHAPWNFSTTNVNGAIGDAWADNTHVLPGPDFSADDWGAAHFPSTVVNTIVAPKWWTAIRTAFGWGA